jgi:hypothetical protein
LTRRQALIAWALCCLLAGGVFLVYAITSLTVGRGQYVMPLDDVYIHFQYAKQMALGQPYVYNPGQPPTSGATSFLYPFILAFGYLIGFQGLNLGIWAMSIGALALACSAYLMVLLARALNAPYWLSLIGAAIFALSGPIEWHFMSGMETGLVTLLVLLTLYQYVQKNVRGVGISGTLLAMIRPEGGLLALIAATLIIFEAKKDRHWLLLTIAALGVQPMANLLFTGSMVATGNQAKSILGMIPFYWDVVIQRIASNFVNIWRDFLIPTSFLDPLSAVGFIFIGILAFVGFITLMLKPESRRVGLLILVWLLVGTAAISTLDTAFWHFKRYQMPIISLLYVLAVCGWMGYRQLSTFLERDGFMSGRIELSILFFVMLGFFLVNSAANYWYRYAANVSYVYAQPLQMARWLDANTPPDATVAVHDVGMMRYMGNRTTIDIVGLTTPGAADAWRNGPGTVAEFLIQVRPDYIAAYTSARGLSYLATTGIYNYGNALVEFPINVDMSANVALAAETSEVVQGIYQPDWSGLFMTNQNSQQPEVYPLRNFEFIDSINVGNLNSETAHHYQWQVGERLSGFATEVREMYAYHCTVDNALCSTLDGGRLINGEESFTLSTHPNQDLLLITRLHPANYGTYDMYVNEQFVDRKWIPQILGTWFEIATLIPSTFVTGTETHIRIVPNTPSGYYMPYYHWALQGEYEPPTETYVESDIQVSFQNGALTMEITPPGYHITGLLFWEMSLHVSDQVEGNYKFFIHVYDDITQPPIAQCDTYLLHTELLGNMLPGAYDYLTGCGISPTPPGHYQVAIGMYDAVTLQNLHPDSGGDELGRVFIGEIHIPEN